MPEDFLQQFQCQAQVWRPSHWSYRPHSASLPTDGDGAGGGCAGSYAPVNLPVGGWSQDTLHSGVLKRCNVRGVDLLQAPSPTPVVREYDGWRVGCARDRWACCSERGSVYQKAGD